MDAIFEVNPKPTDTKEDMNELLKNAQEYYKSIAKEDDFVAECPPDEDNELFEESNSVFTIDGKPKEFSYISSFNKDSTLYSLAQDNLGLWYLFTRTGITSGKKLQGPYRTKDKLLAAMENIHA